MGAIESGIWSDITMGHQKSTYRYMKKINQCTGICITYTLYNTYTY